MNNKIQKSSYLTRQAGRTDSLYKVDNDIIEATGYNPLSSLDAGRLFRSSKTAVN